MELIGKTAVVTGASGELGRYIAQHLATLGMNCMCHYYRNTDAAIECVETIAAMGVKAAAVKADFSDPASASALIQEAEKLGPVRVLINSSSLFKRHLIDKLTPSEAGEMLNVNLAAPMLLCSAFASYIKEQDADWTNVDTSFAAIVNIADVAVVKPWGGYGPYCTSRAGLIGLTKSLAKELAPAVTVNAVAPGIVTWPGKMDPEEEQKQLKMIPTGRFGQPKDITRTIEFLLNNDYITGQVICIDGGRSI